MRLDYQKDRIAMMHEQLVSGQQRLSQSRVIYLL
jgi:hypothetical protein